MAAGGAVHEPRESIPSQAQSTLLQRENEAQKLENVHQSNLYTFRRTTAYVKLEHKLKIEEFHEFLIRQ